MPIEATAASLPQPRMWAELLPPVRSVVVVQHPDSADACVLGVRQGASLATYAGAMRESASVAPSARPNVSASPAESASEAQAALRRLVEQRGSDAHATLRRLVERTSPAGASVPGRAAFEGQAAFLQMHARRLPERAVEAAQESAFWRHLRSH